MRKLLLYALILSGLITSAQTSITNGNCKAAFKYAVNDKVMSLIAATAIDFYDRSEGNINAWFWDFGDGNTSREQNPTFVFNHPLPGTNVKLSPYRTVSLTILTTDNCKSFYSEIINIMDGSIYVTPVCKAGFKYYQTAYDSIGGTATFQLTNLSEGDSLKYSWQFDNSKISNEKEPTVTFDLTRPDRKVCLTITGTNKCTDTFCDAVYIIDPNKPVVDPVQCETAFGYSVNYDVKTFAPALVLNFYSKAWPEPTEWKWDFGDGTTSNETNPTHIFNFPIGQGSILESAMLIRNVCLSVKTVTGCIASHCESINIYMNTTPPIEPISKCVARYKYYQTAKDSIAGTVSFQFNNYSEGDSLSYLWFFDNGKISTEKEPTVTFDIKQLPVKASLTVTGANCTHTFWDVVTIEERVISPDKTDSTQCYTGFSYSINYDIKTFAPALVLDFHSKPTPDIAEWIWDFGDGTSSNEKSPTHIFNFPLAKDSISADSNLFRKVCLTVKTKTGCVADFCESIYIYMNTTKPPDPASQCQAWFKYEKATDVISIPEVIPYRFWDESEGKVVNRIWKFEDGKTSTEAKPLVSFDFQKPTQKVCLTIFTADSCSSTWCETIYVTGIKQDTIFTGDSSEGYSMHYISSFPIYMSSCAGYAKAQVYLKDSLIKADKYVWSTGAIGQEVKGLCPTRTYSVKATTPDGTIVSGTFVFNSDGSVTDNAIINLWVNGLKDNSYVQYNLNNNNYTVEWQLCDGTIIRCDSIPLNSINCGNKEANLILKDASGNIVYNENVSLRTLVTGIVPEKALSTVNLFPNPVNDVLNIQYSGNSLNEMQIEIFDVTGKSILVQKFYNVESGQQISLNVNSLRKGIYLCKIHSDKQIIRIEKFIK